MNTGKSDGQSAPYHGNHQMPRLIPIDIRSHPGRMNWRFAALMLLLTAPCGAASFEERLVAAVLMAEARGEGVVGMTAVGEVIATRARIRRLPPGLVVREPYQFSPLNRAKPRALISRYEKLPLYREALRIADTVIQNPDGLPGLTAGADHFEHIRAPLPPWARGRKPVAVVGNLRFWLLSNHHPGETNVPNRPNESTS
jgi:spore germination cell wall hydrolase CwlJ-like protein